MNIIIKVGIVIVIVVLPNFKKYFYFLAIIIPWLYSMILFKYSMLYCGAVRCMYLSTYHPAAVCQSACNITARMACCCSKC